MRALREFFKSWREERRRQRKAARPLRVPSAIGVAAGIATLIFSDKADPDDLNLGLATLITVNAVVVGLSYATMQTALSLTAKTDERESYRHGVSTMVVNSLFGVLAGIVHLVWSPDWVILLPFAAGFLVGTPALLPVLAAQERRAQRAEARQAAQRLTDDEEDIEEQGTPSGETASEDSGLLRLRHRVFVADPSDPFRNDVLGREPQVKAFCAVLAGIEAPVVLSLDSGWGTGKTAFVKMCAAWIRSEDSSHSDVSVAEFNAWTQSYTGEPLKDIVEAVTSQITDTDTERRKKIARRLELHAARVASGGMLPDSIVADSEGPRRDTLRFKKTLRSFVTEGGGRLVVFIDELDRCRPDYATGVLEKVRHIFDVAGVVVVLSVNRKALEHAVGGPHGPQDAERYMRRFVDQSTRLTDPSNDTTEKFLEYLYEETGISSRMNQSDYTRPMFEALARPEHSSLRDLEQAVHRAAFVLASIPPSSHDPSHSVWAWELTAMTLMTLREVNWDAYRRFVSGYGDAFDAGQGLRTVPPNGSPLNVEGDVRFRMELMFLLSSRNGRPPIPGRRLLESLHRPGPRRRHEGAAGTLRFVHRPNPGTRTGHRVSGWPHRDDRTRPRRNPGRLRAASAALR